jgi:ankyrin repeat protein
MDDDDEPRGKYDVFEDIMEILDSRGKLGKIIEIIGEYDATNPFGIPFDVNMEHEWLEHVTLLQLAAYHGQLEYVEWFLQNGAYPWQTNINSESALHIAISGEWVADDMDDFAVMPGDSVNKSMGVLSILMQYADNHALHALQPVWAKRNKWCVTPIDYAVRKGGAEALKFFISKGALINGPMFTTQYGSISDTLRGTFTAVPGTIPEGNAIYTQFGNSLLHQAVKYRNHDALSILMEDGANTRVCNSCGETPLMTAVVDQNLKAIKVLLDYGTVDILQRHGHVFIHNCRIGHDDGFFTDHTDPDDQYDGWTVLHLLAGQHCLEPRDTDFEILAMLVTAGVDVRAKTVEGFTAHDMVTTGNGDTAFATELKRLERVTPWSAEFKQLREDAVVMAFEKDSRTNSLLGTLTEELFGEMLVRMNAHDNIV